VLTAEDVVSGRDFDDQVARGAYPLDIHDVRHDAPGHKSNVDGGGTNLSKINRSYGIPLRALVAKGVANMTVAGRSLSATHAAAASARGQPVCMATGHAAGVIAALAAIKNVAVRNVDVRELQGLLVQQNAVLERR
jgi:hypothetical protein